MASTPSHTVPVFDETAAGFEDVDDDDIVTFKIGGQHVSTSTPGVKRGPRPLPSDSTHTGNPSKAGAVATAAAAGSTLRQSSSNIRVSGPQRASGPTSAGAMPFRSPLGQRSSNAIAVSGSKGRGGGRPAGNGRQSERPATSPTSQAHGVLPAGSARKSTPSKSAGRLSFDHVVAVVDSGRKSARSACSPRKTGGMTPQSQAESKPKLLHAGNHEPAAATSLDGQADSTLPRERSTHTSRPGMVALPGMVESSRRQKSPAPAVRGTISDKRTPVGAKSPSLSRISTSSGAKARPVGAVHADRGKADGGGDMRARIKSSEAAAASARAEVESLKQRLEALRKDTGPSAIESMRSDLRHSQQVLERVRGQRDAYATACQDAAARIEKLQSELDEAVTGRSAAEKRADQAEEAVVTLKAASQASEATAHAAEKARADLTAELDVTREALERAEAEISGVRAAADGSERRFNEERESLSNAVREAEDRASKSSAALEAVRKAFGRAKAQAEAAAADADKAVAVVRSDADKAVASAESRAAKAESDSATLRSKMVVLAEALREAKASSAKHEASLSAAVQDAETSQTALSETQVELQEAKHEIVRLQAEVETAGKTQEELMAMLEELQSMA